MSSTIKARSEQSFCALIEAMLALAKQTGDTYRINYHGYVVSVGPEDDMNVVLERWNQVVGHESTCLEMNLDLGDEVLITARTGGIVVPDPDADADLPSDQQ